METVSKQQKRLSLSGASRPLPMVGSGVPAAATFCESLADADDAALMRLHIRLNSAVRQHRGSGFVQLPVAASPAPVLILLLKLQLYPYIISFNRYKYRIFVNYTLLFWDIFNSFPYFIYLLDNIVSNGKG